MKENNVVINVSDATVRFNMASERIDKISKTSIDVPGVSGIKKCRF